MQVYTMKTCTLGFNLFLPCSYGAQVGAGSGELSNQAVGAIEGTVVGCKFSANSSESRFVSAVCDLHVAFLDWNQPSPKLEPRRRRRRPRTARHQSGFSFFSFFFPNFVVVKSFEIFFFLFFLWIYTKKNETFQKNSKGFWVNGLGLGKIRHTHKKKIKPCSKCFL